MDATMSGKSAGLWAIAAISAALMIFRVDWWWWGTKIEPLMFGWLSVPMLYQLFIWLAGWALVLWICSIWKRED